MGQLRRFLIAVACGVALLARPASPQDTAAPKAFLGVAVQALTDAVRASLGDTQPGGVLVAQVVPKSPADFVANVGGLAIGSSAVLAIWSGVGKILETDAYEARGTFAPGAKIDPRKNGGGIDTVGTTNAWMCANRFGLEFDT